MQCFSEMIASLLAPITICTAAPDGPSAVARKARGKGRGAVGGSEWLARQPLACLHRQLAAEGVVQHAALEGQWLAQRAAVACRAPAAELKTAPSATSPNRAAWSAANQCVHPQPPAGCPPAPFWISWAARLQQQPCSSPATARPAHPQGRPTAPAGGWRRAARQSTD